MSKHNRGDYIFTSRYSMICTPGSIIMRVLRPLAKKLEMPAFTLRSFWRSAETLMPSHGVPLKVQQQILGTRTPI